MFLVYIFGEYGAFKLIFIEFIYISGWPKFGYWIALLVWSILSILWPWAYFVVSWLDAGSVEAQLKDYKKLPDDETTQKRDLYSIPICNKCFLPKPLRTHHCSICNKCYFRFDHHCPFIGNCIALKNMKPFMLFLFYSGTMLIVGGSSILLYLTKGDKAIDSISWILFGCLSFLGIYLIIFGLTYISDVRFNQTTLEVIAGMDHRLYDVGEDNNFSQIFGESGWKWFLPIPEKIDGFNWAASQPHT